MPLVEVTEEELRAIARLRARRAARQRRPQSTFADMLAGIGPLPPGPQIKDSNGHVR